MTYRALGLAAEEKATIVGPDGSRYTLTDADVLTGARAAWGESSSPEGAAAVLWAWTARHALPRYRRRYPTLSSLIAAHSQPVNPRWARGGEFCGPGGRYEGRDECGEARLARREQYRTASYASIPSAVRGIVERWARAELPNPLPPSAVDFAARGIRAQSGDTLVAEVGGNLFYSEPDSRALPPGAVRMELGDRVATAAGTSGRSLLVGLGVILLAAAGGYAVYSYAERRA